MLSITSYLVIVCGLGIWLEREGRKTTNPVNIQRRPAEALDSWLKNFSWGNRQRLQEQPKLPEYKFYTSIIEVLLNLARKMGGNYEESLLFLREGLQTDRQFEKKLREIIMGTWLQMGSMLILTWGFILAALNFVDVKIENEKLLLISLWQLTGLVLLPFIILFLRKLFFQDIGKIWKMLFILRSLHNVPLSRSEIMVLAEIQELKNIKQTNLFHIVEKLQEACQRALKLGGSYLEDVKYLMEELRFQEKWHFELFEKRLMVVKLGLLSIFFLPSYLAFIFLLLEDLLTLM